MDNKTVLNLDCELLLLPELVSALRGLLDVVMALEPVGVACVAVAAAAKAARFCMALRPDGQTVQVQDTSHLQSYIFQCVCVCT